MSEAQSQESDASVLSRIASGETDAMRTLYERFYDPLMGFILRQCRDEALAADILHDTMLQVWRSAAKFSGASSVKTWVFAIARNKLIDSFRAASKMSTTDEIPDMADDAPDAATVIEHAQDGALVRFCLSKLSERHRAAVELAFFQDLDYKEISAIEKTPVGTIKTRIHHAKKLLMRCLGRRE